MSRKRTKKSDDEFTLQLDLQLAELSEKARQLEQLPERIRREKRESEMTIPPCAELEERIRAKRHEEAIVTRGEVQNVVREHNHSLAMLILLTACTASLLWWALRVMG